MRDAVALSIIGPGAHFNFSGVQPLDAEAVAKLPPTARHAIAAAAALGQDPQVRDHTGAFWQARFHMLPHAGVCEAGANCR